MNIVAVEEEKDDWIRVTGEVRTKTGWIQSEAIRKDKEDVVTAVLLRKALKGKGNNLPREEMEAIIEKLPYPDSFFANLVLQRYNEEETVANEEYVEIDDAEEISE